jgi:hypothetical protein
VAAKYGRTYCGIDISQNYAKKTAERIEQTIKQKKSKDPSTLLRAGNLYFNLMEIDEIKRLFVETGLSISQLIENNKRLEIFTKQFAVRMNNHKKYDAGQVATVIKDFIGWEKRK